MTGAWLLSLHLSGRNPRASKQSDWYWHAEQSTYSTEVINGYVTGDLFSIW